jgi:isopenicillin-N epimerase
MVNPHRQHWTLDPEVTFINHGSYGACPAVVQARQQELRVEMEKEPVRFMAHRTAMFDATRAALSSFLGAPANDIALVPNATHGVNAVILSQRWKSGDQVLVTDHEYNACRNALDFNAARWGAEVVVAEIPFPIDDPQQVVDAMLAEVSDRTVFCLVDHVTSPTALVMPIEKLLPQLQERGIRVLVDGAHAPGQLALDLRSLGADYYTGNLHKWVCAPKGSAFLFVREELQEGVHPVTISHGYNADTATRSRFLQEFDWTGTFDPTAWATVPTVLEFMSGLLDGGWPAVRAHNRGLVIAARDLLCTAVDGEATAPDGMGGSRSTVCGPADILARLEQRGRRLYDVLLHEWGIQVPVIPLPAPLGTAVRISAQVYNELDDYRKLATAILSLRG